MKKKGIRWVILGLLCLVVAQMSSTAMASLTYQQWTFDDDDNPAPPEIYVNEYGVPSALINASGDVTFGSHGWGSSIQGHNGVWYGDTIVADLTIPNRPEPNWYKEVWVEILGRGSLLGEGYTGTGYSLGEGYEVIAPVNSLVEDLGFTATYEPDGWLKIIFGLRIYPNPDLEIIRFTLEDTGAAIDHIIVNTECVPEPMTLVLLGFGGLLCGRIRQR